jgi:hypothetical protein
MSDGFNGMNVKQLLMVLDGINAACGVWPVKVACEDLVGVDEVMREEVVTGVEVDYETRTIWIK